MTPKILYRKGILAKELAVVKFCDFWGLIKKPRYVLDGFRGLSKALWAKTMPI